MISLHTNMASMLVQSNLKSASGGLKQALERMTTGYKINQAKDNAAGYSIANTMQAKIGSYEVAEDNISIGIDLLSTAGDIIGTMQDHAIRLRALAIQARNGTYSAESLAAINAEAEALTSEINRLYNTAEYNGVGLFTGGTAAETTPGTATFAMRRSAEPEVATFAMTRATSSGTTHRDTSSMVTMTQLVNGTTSATNEYSISSKEELVALANYVNTRHNTTGMTFVLGDDIDLSSISNWTPIGDCYRYWGNQFKGCFDGNGYVIKNLTIDDETKEYQGLFGYTTSSSEIKNVSIKSCSIKGTYVVGGLVALNIGASINNCCVTGDVIGIAGNVGALVGQSESSSIINCSTTATISGGGEVGGLVGKAVNTSIKNCYTKGYITGTSEDIGGLVGKIESSSINESYSTGNVIGPNRTGGLVGRSNYTSIINCYFSGQVSGTNNVGGLVGLAYTSSSSIISGYATGSVFGETNVGGLVGSNASSNITNSYSLSKVSGTNSVGGLIGGGSSSGVVSNCASTQADTKATLMTEEQIQSNSVQESLGFTEANGWTIVNGIPMLSWQKEVKQALSGRFVLQIGINGDSSSQIGFSTGFVYDLSAVEANIASNLALDTIDDFLNQLSGKQTKLGAVQNRLESALESNTANIKSLTSSLSTIRDADIAEESSSYIQHQILQNACATLLATANQTPSIALSLI